VSTPSPIPPEYAALVDDAAIFPPGNAPLGVAVGDHREHLAAPHAELVGPFVVSDTRLPELVRLVEAGEPGERPLAVSVVVSGGAGAVEPAARWATASSALELRSLEVALRDPDDLPGNARRVIAAYDLVSGLVPDLTLSVEPPFVQGPPTHGWLAALDELAMADLRLKLRTGGEHADRFPAAADLATAIDAALDRELPFKCTAGLHHAVRHRAEDTGFEHHGFLNVLLATRAALDGDGAAAVAGVLEERHAEAVVRRVREVGSDGLTRARRWFTSFGCCGVRDPLDELVALGLVVL
jgi:hypothetical protein